MKNYLLHWWLGDLESHYHLLWFTIGQVNKLARVGLYLIGLLALFDFIKWTSLIGSLKFASTISVGVIRFAQGLSSAPIFAWGALIAVVRLTTKRFNKQQALAYPFLYTVSTAQQEALKDMEGNLIVRYFGWLEKQPITERMIKIFGFVLFVFFALVELLTS
jgi:hypothetical protein